MQTKQPENIDALPAEIIHLEAMFYVRLQNIFAGARTPEEKLLGPCDIRGPLQPVLGILTDYTAREFYSLAEHMNHSFFNHPIPTDPTQISLYGELRAKHEELYMVAMSLFFIQARQSDPRFQVRDMHLCAGWEICAPPVPIDGEDVSFREGAD